MVWVVNTGCQVSVKVENLLPMELIVNNLTLHTEGGKFEAVPVKLILPPQNPEKTENQSHQKFNEFNGEVMLLGVPREAGLLTLTGYSCEVFDVENVCSLKECGALKPITVRVIPSLPKLQLTTSLKRAPVLDENTDEVAEATVFSGQT